MQLDPTLVAKPPSQLEQLELARAKSTPTEVTLGIDDVELLIEGKHKELDIVINDGNDTLAILDEFKLLVKAKNDLLKAKKGKLLSLLLRSNQIKLLIDNNRALQANAEARNEDVTLLLTKLTTLVQSLHASKVDSTASAVANKAKSKLKK